MWLHIVILWHDLSSLCIDFQRLLCGCVTGCSESLPLLCQHWGLTVMSKEAAFYSRSDVACAGMGSVTLQEPPRPEGKLLVNSLS